MHLGYEVTAQHRVPGGCSESVQRNNVSDPLELVDDSVGVGQVGFVSHSWLAGLSNHSIYLCLDFF